MKKNNKKGFSISAKSLIVNLIIPLIIFVAIIITLANIQFKNLYQSSLVNQKSDGRVLAAQIRMKLEGKFQILKNLGNLSVTHSFVNNMPDSLNENDYKSLPVYLQLKSLLKSVASHESLSLLYIASEKSRGFISEREPVLPDTYDARKRPWYIGAVNSKGCCFISDPYPTAEENAENSTVITISKVIQDMNSKILGVTAMDYNIKEITDLILNKEKESGYRISMFSTRSGEVIWLSGTGIPEKKITLTDLAKAVGYKNEDIPELVKNMETVDGFTFEGKSTQGDTAVITTVMVPDTPWAVTVSMSKNALVSKLIIQIRPVIIIFSIIYIGVLLAGYFITTVFVIKPIKFTSERFMNLASGDADLTASITVKTKDETAELAEGFNKFLARLRTLVVDIKNAMEKTAEIKDNVGMSSEESLTAVEEINANLESINQQFQALDANLAENISATNVITGSVKSMDNKISDQAAMVEQSTAAITQMIASLENVSSITKNKKNATSELDSVAEESRERLDATQKAFKVVSDKMSAIQEMADAINNIASQTNLLSMNAAIEAAHAGDAGRGFAVVAEEIRKLAESAGDSSNRITNLISEVSSAVNETDRNVEMTSAAMEKVFKEVQDTVNAFDEIEHSVSELNVGGRQVLEATEQINTVTTVIRDGSMDIKNGTETMLENSEKIKDASTRVSSGLKEIAAGSSDIVDAMQKLVDLSNELSGIIDGINEKFGKFKT